MGFTDLVTPITSPDGKYRQFGENDSASNSSGYFFAALDAEADVAIVVADSHECLKTGALTSPSLLLYWHNFQNFVIQGCAEEEVDDLELLYGQREQVDALELVDLSFAHEAA